MLRKIKSAVQGRLYERNTRKRQKELELQSDPYRLWITVNECNRGKGRKKASKTADANTGVIFIEDCSMDFSLAGRTQEYLIFVSRVGRMAEGAQEEIRRYFDSHQNVDILYADEDVLMSGDGEERRIFPWSKPIWSPDTLFSFLYFGNIFAVRRETFVNIPWLGDADYRKNIYDFILKATERGACPKHINQILFHRYVEAGECRALEEELTHDTHFIGVGRDYDEIRESALRRRGIRGRMAPDPRTGVSYPIYELAERTLVSLIIPSRDNVAVLKHCIRSIYAHTVSPDYEIIVVDNGSGEESRRELERFREECPFIYLYQPMEFNFSRMCNIGVERAGGEYVLLLNDDMEVLEDSWLLRMTGQASLEYVGAVGAKLLYPDSSKIQHIGVSNSFSGPTHKLRQMDDGVSYYYGRNRFVYDLIAVTGACLLMRRDRYLEMGGLFEGLAVAYNDVDLCFRLHESGLYVVQRNDVTLYHHESLSRGNDVLEQEKFERLMGEKETLYRRHPQLCWQDPFLGRLINDGEPEYVCQFVERHGFTGKPEYGRKTVAAGRLPDRERMNQTLTITIESSGWGSWEGEELYLVRGWVYVPKVDNSRYRFYILFVGSRGGVWKLPVQQLYRKDVASHLSGEKNVELCGFRMWVYREALPPDTYELWMMGKDVCSRQRLYRSMGKTITIGESEC